MQHGESTKGAVWDARQQLRDLEKSADDRVEEVLTHTDGDAPLNETTSPRVRVDALVVQDEEVPH